MGKYLFPAIIGDRLLVDPREDIAGDGYMHCLLQPAKLLVYFLAREGNGVFSSGKVVLSGKAAYITTSHYFS